MRVLERNNAMENYMTTTTTKGKIIHQIDPNIVGVTGWYNPSTGESYSTPINPNSLNWGKGLNKFNKKLCAYCGCKTHIEDIHCCGCGAPVE